eukprot:5689264-Amphidinium_carterae.1
MATEENGWGLSHDAYNSLIPAPRRLSGDVAAPVFVADLANTSSHGPVLLASQYLQIIWGIQSDTFAIGS